MDTIMEDTENGSQNARGVSGTVKIALLGVALAGLFVASRVVDVQGALVRALEWIEGLGVIGLGVFVLAYILASVFLVPASLLTLGAGFVYGLWKGFLLVSVSSVLGATAAFLVGRYLARDWVNAKVESNERFAAIDGAVAREGWKIVGLTRLSPVFPFNLLNYMFGVTKVPLAHYVAASWIGMIPGTVMYVYLGSTAGSLATLGATEGGRTPAQWALLVVGLVVTVFVTVFVTRLAKNALSERAPSAVGNE